MERTPENYGRQRPVDIMVIDNDLIPLLDEMYFELSSERLEVCLIPSKQEGCAKDGGMIRAVCAQNPEWYQKLCFNYPCTRTKKRSNRKDHTRIKRRNVLQLLERMVRNKKSNSMYAGDLLEVAKTRKELYEIPWKNQF